MDQFHELRETTQFEEILSSVYPKRRYDNVPSTRALVVSPGFIFERISFEMDPKTRVWTKQTFNVLNRRTNEMVGTICTFGSKYGGTREIKIIEMQQNVASFVILEHRNSLVKIAVENLCEKHWPLNFDSACPECRYKIDHECQWCRHTWTTFDEPELKCSKCKCHA